MSFLLPPIFFFPTSRDGLVGSGFVTFCFVRPCWLGFGPFTTGVFFSRFYVRLFHLISPMLLFSRFLIGKREWF